jgi:hypothetical protein
MLAGKKRGRAFTLLELLLVIVATAVLLCFIVLPGLPQRHVNSPRVHCANNLKQIGLSFELWAGDNNGRFPMQVPVAQGGTMELSPTNVAAHFRVMSNELTTPKVILCPADDRIQATNFLADLDNSHVSYFIGIDANKTNATMLLAGDRNLTVSNTLPYNSVVVLSNQSVGWTKEIHNLMGNVVLADGSVQQVTTSALRAYLIGSGIATNRLAFP